MECYKQFCYFYVVSLLKKVFDFYLDASIHVALSVYSLVYISTLLLEIPLDNNLAYFLFFGTIASYNFIKYGVEAEKYIMVANRYHKNIQFVSIIALVIALYYGWFLSYNTWFVIIGLVLYVGLYTLPILPKAKNLRSLGGLKVFVVALVWAGATVILPVVAVAKTIYWDVVVECIQRFVLVLVLLIPFEIRDLQYDAPELQTIPQRFGVTKTKLFGAFITIMFYFITFLKDDISILDAISKGILFLTFGMLMMETGRTQKKYFASFWVEAIPIAWGILISILSYFI